MTSVALTVDGVWKRFNRQGSGAPTLKAALLDPFGRRRHRDRFWALQDLNLELRAGETLGVIGANGSGKSTLLRLIAGLGKPTRGRITRRRSIGAMLALGEGFDLLLTGRENAVTAGILAGYTRKQAWSKLEQIVSFAELEEFFDHPLRMYSDGMRVRLAFATAISAEPEILLIDEVLAVGDLRFQSKCYDRLRELQERGTTIVLASHDEGQVRNVCDRVIWLSHGRVQAYGDPDEVYGAYREAMRVETERRAAAGPPAPRHPRHDLRLNENRFGTLEVEIVDVRVLEPGGRRITAADGTDAIGIEIDLESRAEVVEPIVGVSLHRVRDGAKVLDLSTAADGISLGRVDEPSTVALWLDRLDIEPGLYRFDVGVYERNWSYVYDYHWQAYPLELKGRGPGGTFGPPRRWVHADPGRSASRETA